MSSLSFINSRKAKQERLDREKEYLKRKRAKIAASKEKKWKNYKVVHFQDLREKDILHLKRGYHKENRFTSDIYENTLVKINDIETNKSGTFFFVKIDNKTIKYHHYSEYINLSRLERSLNEISIDVIKKSTIKMFFRFISECIDIKDEILNRLDQYDHKHLNHRVILLLRDSNGRLEMKKRIELYKKTIKTRGKASLYGL